MSYFAEVKTAPPPEAFLAHIDHYNDPSKEKLNLVLGGYRTDEGKPWVLPVVSEVEKEIAEDLGIDKEYVQLVEEQEFSIGTAKFLLGTDSRAIKENRVFTCICAGAAGSMRASAEFFTLHMNRSVFYHSNLTWGSHKPIFLAGGFKESREYRYWSNSKFDIDFKGLIEDLSNATEGAVIILQACAHNPTGRDLSEDQWRKVAEVIRARRLFPFFDAAFQGLATGDHQRDVLPVRMFVEMGMELFCVQSFSKNFGLYGERAGNIVVVTNDPMYITHVDDHIRQITRNLMIKAPFYGARIVSYILKRPELFKKWERDVDVMLKRINDMRGKFRKGLEERETSRSWEHTTKQIGMTCLTGLNEAQVEYLAKKHHIYISRNGCFNISCLNSRNIKYVCNAIIETCKYSIN